jgi:hypothetical protein
VAEQRLKVHPFSASVEPGSWHQYGAISGAKSSCRCRPSATSPAGRRGLGRYPFMPPRNFGLIFSPNGFPWPASATLQMRLRAQIRY